MRTRTSLALALVLAAASGLVAASDLGATPGLAASSSLGAAAGRAAANAPRVRHDPFAWPAATRAPLVAAAAVAASAAEPSAKIWQPRLRAVVVAGSRSMVSVDGSVVVLGEEFEGFRLVRVDERSATFAKNGVRVELKMDGGNAATR